MKETIDLKKDARAAMNLNRVCNSEVTALEKNG